MSVSVRVWQCFEVVSADRVISGGSLVTPALVTAEAVGAAAIDRTIVAAASGGTGTLLDNSTDLAAFAFLFIVSDQDVVLEIVTDANAGVGRVASTVTLKAHVAFVLGSNVAYANYTVSFGGGTLDTIDTLKVKNNGSAAANVRLVAVST